MVGISHHNAILGEFTWSLYCWICYRGNVFSRRAVGWLDNDGPAADDEKPFSNVGFNWRDITFGFANQSSWLAFMGNEFWFYSESISGEPYC